MRDIKFRGKRVDNGEWGYGYYVRTTEENDDYSLFEKDWIYDDEGWCRYGVIPETVGQYTGFKDRDGVKIFEGDLIQTYDNYYAEPEGDYLTPMEVKFSEGIFGIGDDGNLDPYVLLNDFADTNDYTVTVIGNIHDNPDALEGKYGC